MGFRKRPTTSEILMRQMIGRARHGPAVGGSEHAYLVSFEDHWDKFRDWDSPFDLVPDIEAVADREAPEAPGVADVDRFQEYLPWDVIRASAMAPWATSVKHKADAFEAVPDGWLVLNNSQRTEQGVSERTVQRWMADHGYVRTPRGVRALTENQPDECRCYRMVKHLPRLAIWLRVSTSTIGIRPLVSRSTWDRAGV
jgi:hypothetical protein